MNTNYRGISLRPDIAALCRCSFNNRYRNTRYRRYGMLGGNGEGVGDHEPEYLESGETPWVI